MAYDFRPGTPEDLPTLQTMLLEAANWSGSNTDRLEHILSRPEVTVILQNWGQQRGDTAVIADDEHGTSVGAAWYRFYTRERHSYGFVDESTPEIAIAVESEHRGHGIGTALLRNLIDQAVNQGIPKLSLSVDRQNPAAKLYAKLGFERIDDEDREDWTMTRKVCG